MQNVLTDRAWHVQQSLSMGCDTAKGAAVKGVLLAYSFGSNSRSCNPFFVRSFAALGATRTDLVILHEEAALPCGGEHEAAAGEPGGETKPTRYGLLNVDRLSLISV
jgi:hypothetical protein